MKRYVGSCLWWECPCGTEPTKHGKAATVRTIVSLREPRCPFCGKAYREEYERCGETA